MLIILKIKISIIYWNKAEIKYIQNKYYMKNVEKTKQKKNFQVLPNENYIEPKKNL